METNLSVILMNNTYNLSDLDKKILEYLNSINSQNKLFVYKINDMAEEMGVTPSKITKTLKKCGFNGLKDFRKTVSMVNGESVSKNKLVQYLEKTLIVSMIKTVNDIDGFDIRFFNKSINEAEQVYIFGGGANIYLAEDFADKLNKIGVRAAAIDIAKSKANNIFDNSLIIALSISGQNYKMHNRIEHLMEKNKNIKLISISLASESNISQFAAKEFSIKFIDTLFLNERELPRHSRILMLTLLDVLFLEYYRTNREKFDKLIEQNKDIIKK